MKIRKIICLNYGVIHKAYFHFFQEGKNVASRYALGRAELYCKAVIAVFCLDGGKNVGQLP